MCGERDLNVLLESMELKVHDEQFVFCTIAPKDLSSIGVDPICIFREAEGLTLIVRREEAQRIGLPYQFPSRMITLSVYSNLDAVGFLAAITQKLAAHGISVNAVSAFYHDHLFVPVAKIDEVVKLLADLSKKAAV